RCPPSPHRPRRPPWCLPRRLPPRPPHLPRRLLRSRDPGLDAGRSTPSGSGGRLVTAPHLFRLGPVALQVPLAPGVFRHPAHGSLVPLSGNACPKQIPLYSRRVARGTVFRTLSLRKPFWQASAPDVRDQAEVAMGFWAEIDTFLRQSRGAFGTTGSVW